MKVGFIGAGNMGSALAKAAAKTNAEIFISDKDEKKRDDLAKEIGAYSTDTKKIAEECEYIFLAVKPNIIKTVLREINETVSSRPDAVIVSMAAGVSISEIEAVISDKVQIIRIMPNTPVAIGKGMILWCTNSALNEKQATAFENLLSKAGELDRIDERLIDAASAVSGCGPAFVYMFIEALSDGAVECGLPRDKAQRYAAETLIGAAELLKATGKHPGELKDAVCSPGGSTISGVHALEEKSFRSAVEGAIVASYKKTLSLSK